MPDLWPTLKELLTTSCLCTDGQCERCNAAIREVEGMHEQFRNFVIHVFTLSVAATSDAAIVKQADYNEHHALKALNTLVVEHAKLRAQLRKPSDPTAF